MSTVLPPVRGKTWIFQITALCIVLGMLLALSLKTQRQVLDEGVPGRMYVLKAEFRATKQENLDLRKELTQYRDRSDDLERQLSEGVRGTQSIEESLAQARVLAGLSAVRGPGVIVTLNDSPKLNPDETDPDVIRDYLVHDTDILPVVNELFSSGAEAISVNKERMIATSSIRCVGASILINSVHVQAPFVIRAIYDSDVLEGSLKVQGGAAESLFLLDMITVTKVKNMVVPAYTGSTLLKFARPAEATEKGKVRPR